MIAKIYGTIEGISNRGVYIRVGGIVYEVFLTVFEKRKIENRAIGEEISLYTLYYVEGGASGGTGTPILVGFQDTLDRDFFELLISVEGIGVGTALRMLSVPSSLIAEAIEKNNLTYLCTLKHVGERTARKIIANLMGKLKPFIREEDKQAKTDKENQDTEKREDREKTERNLSFSEFQKEIRFEAGVVLEQLGYSATEIKLLLAKAFMNRTHFNTVEEVLQEIYQAKSRIRN